MTSSMAEHIEHGELWLDGLITLEQAHKKNVDDAKRKYDSATTTNGIDNETTKKAKIDYDSQLEKAKDIEKVVNQVSKQLGEIKKAAGYPDRLSGNEDNHDDTNENDDEVTMQVISTKDDKQDEEKLIKDAVSTLPANQYRLSEGKGEDEHWTMKYPDKDNLQPLMDQANDKQNENVSPMMNDASFQGENAASGETGETSSKLDSVSTRRAGVGTANSNEKETTSGGAYRSHTNDMRKQDEATVRVTNLPEKTQEEDLRDLFTQFGPVNRVILVKDKTNNTSKGSAFITFNDKNDAQKAIELIPGFCYDHHILKVEWAK